MYAAPTTTPARLIAALAAVVTIAALTISAAPAGAADSPAGDAVVIAVVDSGFSPYNYNYRATQMPQHLDADPSNDLPLDTNPEEWLPGYAPQGIASFGAINLTLEDDPDANIEQLEDADNAHSQLPQSDPGNVNLRYIPGTKIIGAVDFRGGTDGFFATNSTHGNGSAAVSSGNIHGACPECLVVLVRYGTGAEGEAASNWVMQQDWIDVVTNSFGFSTVMRDRIYDGSDTDLQRTASERGQTIFFSSGNGQGNTFTAPNTTIQSSQEGPDWIITVGASNPQGAQYTGTGKPADIASMGSSYPAGYGGSNVSGGTGNFSGTSNATPVTAGTYARALWELRHAMAGDSRVQADGVVSIGALDCGAAVTDCAAGDGEVTASDMRFGLLHSVSQTPQGFTPVGLVGTGVSAPAEAETEFASEGHGTLFGRIDSDENWLAEVDRVWQPLAGLAEPIERTAEEQAWFIADSYCRQQVHGAWDGGYYIDGETELPASTPTWPLRTFLIEGCPTVFGGLKDLGAEAPSDTAPAVVPWQDPSDS